MKTSEMNQKYLQIIKDYDERTYHEICAFKQRLKEDADYFDTFPVEFLLIPKFFNKEIIAHFERIANTTYQILQKVTQKYLGDDNYRKLFRFDPLLESMILSDCRYEALIPIARIDLFYNEDTGTFKFCEFNTDGSSGMAEETDIADGLSETYAFHKFSKDLDVGRYELFDSLVDGFMNVYAQYPDRVERPLIAIVDFLESGISNEFEIFRQSFEKKGCNAIIADIRKLTYRDGDLYAQDRKIDAVYRRAVTGEIMAKKDTCEDFIQSVLEGKVCIIGHIRSQVAHVKLLFAILRRPETQELLTEEENQFVSDHFPFTTVLSSGNYDYNEVLLNKDKWIIKPSDMYASKFVYAGIELSDEDWSNALELGIKNDFLLQEYVAPFETLNFYFDEEGELVVDMFGNITGLYLYDGQFSGVFSRAGRQAIISAQHDGFSLGSMYVNA